jgi:hypothetical protein
VTTAAQRVAYRDRIRAAVPEGIAFEPVMSLYLTDKLPPEEIALAAEAGVRALKLYPGGRHHQQRCRRDRHPQHLQDARGHAEARPAAAGAWRGD